MNKKRFVGFVLVLVGILLSLSQIAITGAVIGAPKTALLNLTTAIITVVGVLMIIAAGGVSGASQESELERKVRVHKIEGEGLRTEDDRTILEGDDVRYIDERGFVSLNKLRAIYGQARKRLNSEQYNEFVETNKIIGGTLLDELKSGEIDSEERENAVKFLELLYQIEIPRVRVPQDLPLKNNEKERIDNVFGGAQWGGEPSKAQRKILRQYGLAFEPGEGHGKIYVAARPGIYATTSSTPGDVNAGHAIGRDVVRLVNTYRQTSKTKVEYKLPD